MLLKQGGNKIIYVKKLPLITVWGTESRRIRMGEERQLSNDYNISVYTWWQILLLDIERDQKISKNKIYDVHWLNLLRNG